MDALRPSDDEYNQVLQESLRTWTSYLGVGNNQRLPPQAINLRPLVIKTPSFLGDGPAFDETNSFACEEKGSAQEWEYRSLQINGRSTWRFSSSKGSCDLPPKVLPMQAQLAIGSGSRLNVTLSEDAALSDWPRVQGLEGNDGGNYLSVLYFAWAYILSARWVELLGRSADHQCCSTKHLARNTKRNNSFGSSDFGLDQHSTDISDLQNGYQSWEIYKPR